jgi:rhamnosyltransferase
MNSPADKPKVSFVIRCFNEEKHIAKLLEGISFQTEKNWELILVDSGSLDKTCDIALKFGATILHIRPEEFSFGRALNLGCREARGEFLVFASAHVYPVFKDWLDTLLKPFEDPKVALVYGKQRGNGKTKFAENQIFEKWYSDTSDDAQKESFCNNANLAIRKSLWEEQPYDERLTGLEDIHWGQLVLNKGYRIAYCAQAEIKHVHDESYSQILNRYRREAIAFKTIYPLTHFSLLSFVKLSIQNIFMDWIEACKQNVLRKNLFPILAFRCCQFYGMYLGYRNTDLTLALKKKLYYPKSLKRESLINESDRDKMKIHYGKN